MGPRRRTRLHPADHTTGLPEPDLPAPLTPDRAPVVTSPARRSAPLLRRTGRRLTRPGRDTAPRARRGRTGRSVAEPAIRLYGERVVRPAELPESPPEGPADFADAVVLTGGDASRHGSGEGVERFVEPPKLEQLPAEVVEQRAEPVACGRVCGGPSCVDSGASQFDRPIMVALGADRDRGQGLRPGRWRGPAGSVGAQRSPDRRSQQPDRRTASPRHLDRRRTMKASASGPATLE